MVRADTLKFDMEIAHLAAEYASKASTLEAGQLAPPQVPPELPPVFAALPDQPAEAAAGEACRPPL